MIELLHNLLFVGTIEIVGAVVVLVVIRTKHNLNLGPVRQVTRGSKRAWLLILPAILAVGIMLSVQDGIEFTHYVPGLIATMACLLLQPQAGSAALGAKGVRTGWRSRKFEELDEWRLTGGHLRVQINGHWGAVEVPAAGHAALREQLESICSERESRFRD